MLQAMREGIGRWVVIVILALIAFGFIFFGIDFTATTTTYAARVNGEQIPLVEFERALQIQQTQYAQLYRMELDDELRRTMRAAVIENLVGDRVLKQRVTDAGYRASDVRVAESIQDTEAFQVGGQFSIDIYRARLAAEGIAPLQFEEDERTRLAVNDLRAGIVNSTFLTPAEFRAYIELTNQRREVGYALFEAATYLDDIAVADEDVAAYYEENASLYQSEETVDFEYVEVTQADAAAEITISDDELLSYYESEQDLFEREEERSVRHILFTDQDETVAEERAEEALTRINAGESFEEVARDVSDDPGTRAQGGDLGRIIRGMLEGPFEETAFSLNIGEISMPVRSDFGLHIIRLDGISEGDVQSFETVRDDLFEQLRAQRAEDLFFEQANELADEAYYGDGDLATIAAGLMLPVVTVEGFPRTGDPSIFDDSALIVQAAFSDEVLLEGRNSNLIELGEGRVLVLNVINHAQPEQLPLEVVEEQIREELRRRQATDQAQDAAVDFAAGIAADAADPAALATELRGTWNEPAWQQRSDAGAPLEVVSRAFALEVTSDGAATWDTVALAGGDTAVMALYRVEAGQPENIPREARDERQAALGEQAALMELSAYAVSVRDAARVQIPEEVLEPVFY